MQRLAKQVRAFGFVAALGFGLCAMLLMASSCFAQGMHHRVRERRHIDEEDAALSEAAAAGENSGPHEPLLADGGA